MMNKIQSDNIITYNIEQRQDDIIVFTKRELEVIDSSINGFNIGSKILLVLGSSSLGYALNAAKYDKNIIIILGFSIFACMLGFYLEFQKDSNIKKVLKSYKK